MIEDQNLGAPEGDDEAGDVALPPKAAKATKATKTASAPKAAAADEAPKKVRIVLEENDNIPPTGLFLGINGRSFMIRPGEEVDVPMEVIECLNDAVMATPKTDNNGNITDFRSRLRFPYRIISQSV